MRPLANPLPLGFLGLAGGTLLLSGLQLGWLAPADSRPTAAIVIAFVVPVQLIASVFGFLRDDVAAGTGMGVLSGTWLAIGITTLTAAPGSTSDPLGLFLFLAAAAMAIAAAAAATVSALAAAVITTTVVRFAVTGVYQLTGSGVWKDLSGVVGLVLCALAVTVALVLAVEGARAA